MSDYQDALEIFRSESKAKHPFADGLERRWFKTACEIYSLDIEPLAFDEVTDNFTNPPTAAVLTIGLIMAVRYLKQQRSRFDQLQSIIARDISLTATGDQKRALKAQYDDLVFEVESKLHKQKKHSFS